MIACISVSVDEDGSEKREITCACGHVETSSVDTPESEAVASFAKAHPCSVALKKPVGAQ